MRAAIRGTTGWRASRDFDHVLPQTRGYSGLFGDYLISYAEVEMVEPLPAAAPASSA